MDIFLAILNWLTDNLLTIFAFIAIMYILRKWDGKIIRRTKRSRKRSQTKTKKMKGGD